MGQPVAGTPRVPDRRAGQTRFPMFGGRFDGQRETSAGWIRLAWLFAVFAALLPGGCATYTDRLLPIRNAAHRGDLDEAERLLERQLRRGGRDTDVLLLEQAILQLAGGEAAEAEQTLRQVRDRFDHLEQASLAEAAISLLTDDQRLAYAGEDYEQVLIRAFLALANLVQGGEDAEAYCLQMVDKQAQIVASAVQPDGTNPKAGYQQVALAPYLRAALREATHRDFDDVARSREMVVSWSPEFYPGQDDLARARYGRHSQPGHGVLYAFALVGRGPFKEEVDEMPTTAALFAAEAILTATGNRTLPPIPAPVKVPRIFASPNLVSQLGVSIDGVQHGHTATITDVGQMAVAQCEAEFPQVVARAVVRRTLKEAAVYAAKESVGAKQGSFEAAGLELAGLAWQLSENADTRCWGLLPDRIQVLRLELPAGQHELRFEPLDQQRRAVGPPATTVVSVPEGRNTYVLVNFPGPQRLGGILTSPAY